MTHFLRMIVMLSLTCLTVSAGAQPRMYKCKQANDTYSFQAEPCAQDLPQQVLVKERGGALKAMPTDNEKPKAAPPPAPALTVIPSKPAPPVVVQNAPPAPVEAASAAKPRAKPPAETQATPWRPGGSNAMLVFAASLFVAALVIFYFSRGKAVAIDVLIEAPLKWPMYCTQCGKKQNLRYVSTTIQKTESISSWLLLVGVRRYRVSRYTLQYPACSGHAFKAQLASLVAGTIGMLISLFAAGYLFQILDSLVDGKWASMHVNQKVVTTAYVVLLLSWLLVFTFSQGWSPMRLSRWKKPSSGYGRDTVRLTFGSEKYAQEFARVNRQEKGIVHVGQSSWLNAIIWPRMIIYFSAVAMAWTLVSSRIL